MGARRVSQNLGPGMASKAKPKENPMKAASTLITAAFVAGLSLPAAAQDPGKMAETVGNSLTTAPAA